MSGRLIIVVLAVVAIGAGVVLFAIPWASDDTFCSGLFKSADQAEAAIEDARDAGFRLEERRVAERAQRVVIRFGANETGDDARELREEFQRILARHDGGKGHPGDGCWERGIGD